MTTRGRLPGVNVPAVLIGIASALALLWGAEGVRAYRAWVRRGRSGPPPSRHRLRLAVYAALVVIGAILGAIIGAWPLHQAS